MKCTAKRPCAKRVDGVEVVGSDQIRSQTIPNFWLDFKGCGADTASLEPIGLLGSTMCLGFVMPAPDANEHDQSPASPSCSFR